MNEANGDGDRTEADLVNELESLKLREDELRAKLEKMREARLAQRAPEPELFQALNYPDEQSLQEALRAANADPVVARSAAMHVAKIISPKQYLGLEPMDGLAHWLGLAAEGGVCSKFWNELRQSWTGEVGSMSGEFLASSFRAAGQRDVREALGEQGLAKLAELAARHAPSPQWAQLNWTHLLGQTMPSGLARPAKAIVEDKSVAEVMGAGFDGCKISMTTQSKKHLLSMALLGVKSRSMDVAVHDQSMRQLATALSGVDVFGQDAKKQPLTKSAPMR